MNIRLNKHLNGTTLYNFCQTNLPEPKEGPALSKAGRACPCRRRFTAFCKKHKKRYRPAWPRRYTKKPEKRIRLPVTDLQPD